MIYAWLVARTIDNWTDICWFIGKDHSDVCHRAYEYYKEASDTDLAEAPIAYRIAKSYEEFIDSPVHVIYYADTEYSDHIMFEYRAIDIKEDTE